MVQPPWLSARATDIGLNRNPASLCRWQALISRQISSSGAWLAGGTRLQSAAAPQLSQRGTSNAELEEEMRTYYLSVTSPLFLLAFDKKIVQGCGSMIMLIS